MSHITYNEAFAATSFTVESLLHYTPSSDNQFIFGRWQTSQDRRGWYLRISDTGELQFLYSNDGVQTNQFNSGVILNGNTDYYIGFSYDSSVDGQMTFWYQNLTDEGTLDYMEFDAVGELNNPDWGIQIGSNSASNTTVFQGYFDEIRYSAGALGQDQLLASIPEPRHVGIIGAVAVLGTVIYFRRKK